MSNQTYAALLRKYRQLVRLMDSEFDSILMGINPWFTESDLLRWERAADRLEVLLGL